MAELGWFLNVDKPPGLTSRDVVDRVGRVVGVRRIGHAGTLDPMATGVLVLAVERATRLVEYVQRQPKTYDAEILLGCTSDTDDVEGRIEPTQVGLAPDRGAVEAALGAFVGLIEQTPPAFSAVKLAGCRAYKLARLGRPVDLAPRSVHVHSVSLLEYCYPRLALQIVCGSGAYIRSIARDLGAALGVGGVLSRLRRTAVGVFTVDSAIPLDEWTPTEAQVRRRPLADAVRTLRKIAVDPTAARRLHLGQRVVLPSEPDAPEAAIFDAQGRLLGVGRVVDGLLQPIKMGFVEPTDADAGAASP
jgi:tRNA pseudouridine55 synthase